jgi:hypothetical protein
MPPLLNSKQELEAVLPKISLIFSSAASIPRSNKCSSRGEHQADLEKKNLQFLFGIE